MNINFALMATMIVGLAAGTANAEATVEGKERPPAEKHEMMRQKMQEHLKQIDTDGNGAISKAEFMAEAEQKFAKMDANADGQITQDERDAMHKKMKEMMKSGSKPHDHSAHPQSAPATAKP